MINRFNEDKNAGKTVKLNLMQEERVVLNSAATPIFQTTLAVVDWVKLEDLSRKYRIKYNDFITHAAKETPGSAFVTLNGQSLKQGNSKDKTDDSKQKRSSDEVHVARNTNSDNARISA
jgi:hypothetical protein